MSSCPDKGQARCTYCGTTRKRCDDINCPNVPMGEDDKADSLVSAIAPTDLMLARTTIAGANGDIALPWDWKARAVIHAQTVLKAAEALPSSTAATSNISDVKGDNVKSASASPEKQAVEAKWIEEELKDGDRICEAAGVQRTEGGRLPVAKIVNKLRSAPRPYGTVGCWRSDQPHGN